jgi:hypothetical protein
MADTRSSVPNSNNGLYFIVGGLVAVLAVGAFAYQQGYLGSFGAKTTIEQTTTAPSADGATTTTTTKSTTP